MVFSNQWNREPLSKSSNMFVGKRMTVVCVSSTYYGLKQSNRKQLQWINHHLLPFVKIFIINVHRVPLFRSYLWRRCVNCGRLLSCIRFGGIASEKQINGVAPNSLTRFNVGLKICSKKLAQPFIQLGSQRKSRREKVKFVLTKSNTKNTLSRLNKLK